MTGIDFATEVFSNKNIIMIDHDFKDGKFNWGVLCLHLLAKEKEVNPGFTTDIGHDELYWIEDFLQQMCRIKNPSLFNVVKSTFLVKTAIEGITDSSTTSRGEHIKTFRNAIGFDD